ncbi:zinc finger and SCAN domain-containing protein 2-like [Melospiza melodia melodia]|uniref:zinc finger and SCAN domain-containing protein 2-like n=1 Tax=Melospiza melodia melodia TaxID=1914991 RepID=UPI002FD11444
MPKGEPEERPGLPRGEGSGTDPLAGSQPRAGALGCAGKSRRPREAAGPGRGEGPAEQTRGSGEGGAEPREGRSARGPGFRAWQETRCEVNEKGLSPEGDCVLGDNEEERSFPEDLKQEELPQVRETQSPERGPACDVSPHEQRDFRKFTLDADGETLHCEEKPFKCPECGKGFKGHCRLLTHLQIHTREKVFVCAECGKSFGRKANLVVHQRVHTGERPYKCKEYLQKI